MRPVIDGLMASWIVTEASITLVVLVVEVNVLLPECSGNAL